MGSKLCHIYPHATKWEVIKFKTVRFVGRFIVTTLALSAFLGIVYGAFKAGGSFTPEKMVYANVEVVKEVESASPVMDRIAKCESGGKHTKGGQVILNGNKNGSVDVGLFQINMSIWGNKATAMGLNLMVEADNRAFANYLYKNYGTEPWVWSKPCWNK